MIHSILHYFYKHLIVTLLFLLLSICLFFGDGQQMPIDMIGAGGVLILTFVAFFYCKKKRELPVIPVILWTATILYFGIRTVFSDDIGYSVYTTVRLIDLFVVFYIVYCFLTDEDRYAIPVYLLVFCTFSLVASFLYMLIPSLANTLPRTNLLIPTYGHNNIVDILLFGIPVAFFMCIQKKDRLYVFLFIFFLLGVFLSFARATMIVISLFIVISLVFLWKNISGKRRLILGIFSFGIIGFLSILLFMPQNAYQSKIPTVLFPRLTKQVDGANNRFEYFRQAIMSIRERPLFGTGPGTFLLTSKRFQSMPDSYSRYAHNELLQKLSEVGVVGTLPLMLFMVWCGIRIWHSYRFEGSKNRDVFIILSSGIILVTLNAMLDFSLDYFIVSMLYVPLLASLVSFGKPNGLVQPILAKITITLSITIVFIFYIIMSVCSIGLERRIPFLSNCCYLSEFISTNDLKDTKKNWNNSDIALINRLHNKNPDVLLLIAQRLSREKKGFYMSRVFLADPKNKSVYAAFFNNDILINTIPKSEQLLYVSRGFLTLSAYERIERIFRTIDNDAIFSQIRMDFLQAKDMKSFLAKKLYEIGVQVFPLEYLKTRDLWTISAEIDPSLSYYRIELASLYAMVFHDEKKSREQLELCLENRIAYAHCFMILEEIKQNGIGILPPVGFFRGEIQTMNN